MAWLQANLVVILGVALAATEAAAAITQLLAPSNKGISGFIAGIIKVLQTLGAKDPS